MDKQLAFVFPGQGSQFLGMMNPWIPTHPSIKETFDQASMILGCDLLHLVESGPEEELNKTARTQPVLLVAGVAIWRVWQQQGGDVPAILAGHSLGEYTALVCAEALSFTDAVSLVALRGEMMQAAVPEGEGAMAAIVGLDDGRVEEICKEAAGDLVLTPANYNSLGQVVIAGSKRAVEKAMEMANDAGARLAKILAVSVPAHCPLMKPAALEFAKELEKIVINKPKIKIINNVDAKIVEDPASIKEALTRQLYSPVRWVETILRMQEIGIKTIHECGPGKVLTGLIKRIDRNFVTESINDPETLTRLLNK